MKPWRLLQGLDHMGKQAIADRYVTRLTAGIREQVADDAFTAFIDKERITNDSIVIDCRITRQDLRIDVAQDHLGGALVVPRHPLCPGRGFAPEKRPQVSGGVMAEIEYLDAIKDALLHS